MEMDGASPTLVAAAAGTGTADETSSEQASATATAIPLGTSGEASIPATVPLSGFQMREVIIGCGSPDTCQATGSRPQHPAATLTASSPAWTSRSTVATDGTDTDRHLAIRPPAAQSSPRAP